MSDDAWDALRELAARARELPPEKRAVFLEQTCAGDILLRTRIQTLLASDAPGRSPAPSPDVPAGTPGQMTGTHGGEPRAGQGQMLLTVKICTRCNTHFTEGQLVCPNDGEILVEDPAALVGTTLDGLYQVERLIGRGGMGAVYLARHLVLRDFVAVKVLPREVSANSDWLRRFVREGRAARAIRHPNVVTVHDLRTSSGGFAYMVLEYIEGHTLRVELDRRKRFTPAEALEILAPVASGLDEAHAHGVVHRDLKPENIMIGTSGGRQTVKLLDLGIAKLREIVNTTLGGQHDLTVIGQVIGTPHYMSPEQWGEISRDGGAAVDGRSDVYSLGVLAYQMVSGRLPFEGHTLEEIHRKHLQATPRRLRAVNRDVPKKFARAIERALSKDRTDRQASAGKFVDDLSASLGLRDSAPRRPAPVYQSFDDRIDPSAPTVLQPAGVGAASDPRNFETVVDPASLRSTLPTVLMRWSGRRIWPIVAGVALLLLLPAVFFAGKRMGERPLPSFQQLTFRRGTVHSARFAPDGRTILYGAAWEGGPIQVFSTRPESPESRPLGLPDADLLAVSSAGEMALSLGARPLGFLTSGTLARVSLAGGAPRELLENVQGADWSPDGASLAVVRAVEGRYRLEYPVGRVLYETEGHISYPRVSPAGDAIAFFDHPFPVDDRGSLAIVDLKGDKRTLASGWSSEQGLAWSPGGDEVWFTATESGANRALYAVTRSGKQRMITRVAGPLTLHDISRDGRVLLSRDGFRQGMVALAPGEKTERDVSWLDWSIAQDMSADGSTILFDETGEGARDTYGVYLRRSDGSPAVRLGDGFAKSLSPDGKWVISMGVTTPAQFVLLPTGPGEARQLTADDLDHQAADWFPDGTRILFVGQEPGRRARSYVQALDGGSPVPITPEGTTARFPSADGRFVVARGPDHALSILSLESGESRPVAQLDATDVLIRWSGDERSIYLRRRGEFPAKVYRLDVATGRREIVKELMPPDPAGVFTISSIHLSADGESHAYSYGRALDDLYLVDGLK